MSAIKTLVIVESPTKAKTIKKYLGDNFVVESCMGHIRDLPKSAKDIPEAYKKEAWSKLGVNVTKDFDPIYCIPKNKKIVVSTLKKLLKDADELILATDEDREGESISWHLLEVLKPKVPVKRMVFHEITKKAINEALSNCRDIDFNLVKAQEVRRILDRLVGYTLSPLVWKKVAYGLSAGRVQSVAVRLISEREIARLKFIKAKYWGIANLFSKGGKNFESKFLSYKKKRLASGKDFNPDTGKLLDDKKDQVHHLLKAEATSLSESFSSKTWEVISVEEKPVTRKPVAPFITSTLQQEANRKLGLSARETMSVAQGLYEKGFITYMRTDSTFLSNQALESAREKILTLFGEEYLPEAPRTYLAKKSKGAQEAHEAIRPSGVDMVSPENSKLRGKPKELYSLIWRRTIASQMTDSKQKQVQIRIESDGALFSSSGMTIEFPGFLKVYEEEDGDNKKVKEVHLPKLTKGDVVNLEKTDVTEHETKPPARFNEASLVQILEKEGVGRPSTYASIIGTIQDRGYVNKVNNILAPTFTALVVSRLLSTYLTKYVDLEFTSGMENSLDDIALGEVDGISYLREFYSGEGGLLQTTEEKDGVIDPEESRAIKFDIEGWDTLTFKVGRYGAYVCRKDEEGADVCASIPDAQAPGDLTFDDANKLIDIKISGADALGKDPETGDPIYVLTGRYGPYVQLGDVTDENTKPKRSSIPANIPVDSVDMDMAQFLLSLPRTIGQNPDTEEKKDVKVGIGRFGPYVVCDGDFRSIPKTLDIMTITFDDAMVLLRTPKKGRRGATVLKELGVYPDTEDKISLMTGKYGPYLKCGKVNLSVPDDIEDPEKLEHKQAVELLAEKVSAKMKKAKKKVAKKTAKKTTKKKTTKKKTTKKASSKSSANDEDESAKKKVKKVVRVRKKVDKS